MKYTPHQNRVIEEHAALADNAAKLKTFLGNPIFKDLPVEEQVNLRVQLHHMEGYLNTLAVRISAFIPLRD
jgi:hypothetical protein